MNWLREPDTEPIPGYRLIEPIGTGGFGEVWKCVAPGGILKAIKFVYGNLNSLDGDDARAEQEQKALQRVKNIFHPFVCQIDRIDVVNGELVIVMELAEKTLHDCLLEYQAAGRPGIPREVLLGFLDDAAVGLDYLIEKHNLQHLDVKPRNLFYVAERVKVADFGLVKHLERSSSSGLMGGVTPIYAAPETFSNKISKHSDQYSLAIVYCELLTGKRPFNGKNVRQLALQHMTEAPDLSMLPEADRPIVARALAKDPDERFSSCTAFIRALSGGNPRAGESSGPSSATEPMAWSKASKTMHDVDLTPPAARRPSTPYVDLGMAPRAMPQPAPAVDVIDEEHLLAITQVQKEVALLRPTILIGLGSFGRRALQELRCRLLDRIGDLSQVPCYRVLYVDCDPDAIHKAINAPPGSALASDEVFPVPLQAVTGYRRRQLDTILDWLPREKLYSIPRSLQTNGSRALGRLAFCDNYLRFITRLRRELQIATHPESMAQSRDQTGLAIRDAVPQIFVFASATGGSSGMLMDLGYAIRRVLSRLNAVDAPVNAFIYAGAPKDPNGSDFERANLYASITELNHYADPDVTFVGQYGGPEGPRVEGRGLPFTSIYLLPLGQKTSADFRDCLAHLAGYVTHELTTPLGLSLETLRSRPPELARSPFRSFGTYGVWFPRGLLLRAAAQRVCKALLAEWLQADTPAVHPAIDLLITQIMGDPRLKADAVQGQIEREATRGHEGGPGDQLERWLCGLEGQIEAAARRGDAGRWARNAWEQAREFIGTRPTSEIDSAIRRSSISRTLEEAIRRVADCWANEFSELTRGLEEQPGRRLAMVETALTRIMGLCSDAAHALEKRLHQHALKCQQSRTDVQCALDACQGGSGSFSFFGGRSSRSMRYFLDQLRHFVRLRLQEDMLEATAQFYRKLRARLEDRLRDLAFCRTRLEQLLKLLDTSDSTLSVLAQDTPFELSEEALQQTIHPTNTLNIVLPAGDNHLERSAARLTNTLQPQDYVRLDTALQKLVLEPRGGLIAISQTNTDMTRLLLAPMVEQTVAFLSDLLPATDVTEVEFSALQLRKLKLSARIEEYIQRAAPPCGSATPDEQIFVLVPDSESGSRFAQEARNVCPKVVPIAVQNAATDLLFCREHGGLTPEELCELLNECRPAYEHMVGNPAVSPHARFDVVEWLPLDE